MTPFTTDTEPLIYMTHREAREWIDKNKDVEAPDEEESRKAYEALHRDRDIKIARALATEFWRGALLGKVHGRVSDVMVNAAAAITSHRYHKAARELLR